MPKKKISKKKKTTKKKVVEEKKVNEKGVSEEKKFLVVYQGIAGKKAISTVEAIKFAQTYMLDGKCKKADIYELIKRVE